MDLQLYTLLVNENVMRRARLPWVLSIRYMDRVTAVIIAMMYFPAQARCGKIACVSL